MKSMELPFTGGRPLQRWVVVCDVLVAIGIAASEGKQASRIEPPAKP